MVLGTYLLGYFETGKMSKFMLSHKKPFGIDLKTGVVTPLVFRVFGGSVVFDEWHYFEGHKMSDFNTDNQLRNDCNTIWADWCKKYNRKVQPLLQIE